MSSTRIQHILNMYLYTINIYYGLCIYICYVKFIVQVKISHQASISSYLPSADSKVQGHCHRYRPYLSRRLVLYRIQAVLYKILYIQSVCETKVYIPMCTIFFSLQQANFEFTQGNHHMPGIYIQTIYIIHNVNIAQVQF